MTERVPEIVGVVTLIIGTALLAAPGRVTGPLGLAGEDAAMRMVGAADLALVPGLLRGRARWPWMASRAALNVAQAAYLFRVAPRSSSPALVRTSAGLLASLTAVDGATALTLRRAGS